MRKIVLSICLAYSLLFINSGPAQAISIDLLPHNQEVNVNTTVDVDVVISGLGGSIVPSLGTYDLSINYDPTMLSLVGVNFGDQLDLFGLGSIQIVDDSLPGVVGLYESSFDLPDDLNMLQLPEFTIATLTFNTILPGLSSLNLGPLYLGDAYGDQLFAGSTNGAQVNAVPIPGAVWLFYSGLACLIAMGRREKTGKTVSATGF